MLFHTVTDARVALENCWAGWAIAELVGLRLNAQTRVDKGLVPVFYPRSRLG